MLTKKFMAFCAYCGKQLNKESQFCPACGKEIKERSAGTAQVLAQWEADRVDPELHSKRGEGIVKLTRESVVYHETKRKNKEDIVIPFSKINSVVKMPLFKMVSITYNFKKGQGALKSIFGRKILALKFKEAKEFTAKFNELKKSK